MYLGELPGSVRAEAARGVVAIPKGPLNTKQTAGLVVRLRRSELRKQGAVMDAVADYARKRRDLATRGVRAAKHR